MQLRRHISFANLASATALALVLGGGVAVAAGVAPNSVGSKQIKPNAVKSSDISKNAVKSSDIKNDTVKGKDIKESTLGAVPSVETVVADERATSAVGVVPVTVYESGPFTITLRCVDGGGGNVRAFLEIRTSVDDAAFDANLSGGDHADLDIFDGPQSVGDTANVATPEIEHVGFAAVSPQDEMIQGYGYVASKLHGSAGCSAQLTFIG